MMAITEQAVVSAARVPGPPELLPGRPDAVVDLQADEGAALVGGQWRYGELASRSSRSSSSRDPAQGTARAGRRAQPDLRHRPARPGRDFDDSRWATLAPAETMRRLSTGRVCFNWYRIEITIPERVGPFDPTGSTVVFEVAVDDYAEVWVNGELPLALGLTGGQVVAGFNAPTASC